MANTEIRNNASNAGIYLWQIADKLGMQDSNFSRKLRKELSETEKARIREIIAELKAEAEHEN